MPEIISFSGALSIAQKDRFKKEANARQGLKNSAPAHPGAGFGFSKNLLSKNLSGQDMVHFAGNNKKRKPDPLSGGEDKRRKLVDSSDSESSSGTSDISLYSDSSDDVDVSTELTSVSDEPGALMSRHIRPLKDDDSEWEAYGEAGEPYAEQLAEITSRPYLNNAVLKAETSPLQKAILMKLKDKLGSTPIYSVDCHPDHLEQLESHYDDSILPNVFAEPANALGLPKGRPTVLVLQNADSGETQSLQNKEAFQRVKKQNPNFRFVIAQDDMISREPDGGLLAGLFGGLSRNRLGNDRPAPFEKVDVKPLTIDQWSKILPQDKQAKALLDHWKLNFPTVRLKQFLNILQKEKPGGLDRDQLLGELDSLASFIRLRQKDKSPEVTAKHIQMYTKGMKPSLSPKPKVENKGEDFSSDPLEQKPYELIKSTDIKARLNDVIGNDRAKEVLSHALESSKYPELYAHLNDGDEDARNNYVLLMGEPGGGKTMLARAIAGEGKGTFISSTGSQFVNVFVGMGANNMRQLKAAIEQASDDLVVVFMDEIDSLGNRKDAALGGGGSNEDTKTINQFLALAEGVSAGKKKILLIGATNRPDALDPAILSRFHHKIDIPKLNSEQRKALLNNQMKQKKLVANSSVDMAELVKLTEGLSGRDLRNIMKLAKQELIQKMPAEQKEKLEKDPQQRKAFQLTLSQDVLLRALAEVKKGWNDVKGEKESPPPFGMYS